MSDLVGIIRKEEEIEQALDELEELSDRGSRVAPRAAPAYNPGWHLALDLRNMLLIAECVARAALDRQESRGGHTRDDYPEMSPEWRKINVICAAGRQPRHRPGSRSMRDDVLALFDRTS